MATYLSKFRFRLLCAFCNVDSDNTRLGGRSVSCDATLGKREPASREDVVKGGRRPRTDDCVALGVWLRVVVAPDLLGVPLGE